MLKNLLESGKCFKLVCGAGNEDAAEVEKLTFLYAKAGCRFFDLNASEKIVSAARKGLEKAGVKDAYLCVSVGIKGDPHVSKAIINPDKCNGCGLCDGICPQKAICCHKVKRFRCIGCGKCAKICPQDAITYISEPEELSKILPPLIATGIDCVELHAMGGDFDEIKRNWEFIRTNFRGMLSICTGRGELSDCGLVKRIKIMIEGLEPYRVIVQADGFPMSGGSDDFKTTLQTVACAEIVQNAKLPVYIMLSGGTNSKTAGLAQMCGINYNGIAIGTYARKIVRKYLEKPDFSDGGKSFSEAFVLAETLVKSV